MEPGKRVALYARVSTPDQTPENQLLDLRRYCAARGWTPVEPAYVDIGISGAKKDRPALGRLMEDVRKRRVDVVFVWRFDRFARSVSHLVEALETFEGLGVGFASFSENVDTTTSQGKLLFHIMAALAQFEREIIRERIFSGIRRARDSGKKLGRPGFSEQQITDIRALYGTCSEREASIRLGVSKAAVNRAWKPLRRPTLNPMAIVA